jgi:hypothetical protein
LRSLAVAPCNALTLLRWLTLALAFAGKWLGQFWKPIFTPKIRAGNLFTFRQTPRLILGRSFYPEKLHGQAFGIRENG